MALAPVPQGNALLLEGRLTRVWFAWLQALLDAVNQRTPPIVVAQLPAAPVAGMLVAVTDATSIVWGAAVVGGGAHTVLAFYNGTGWTVAAK